MATNPQLPNNSLRFPAGPIDFSTEVGITGQDHDDYPEGGQQARFDWMRMVVISMLSQQSSYEEPTQYREGTPWFDMSELALKIRRNGQWVPYAQAVLIDDGYTLSDFYAAWAASSASPDARFNGTATVASSTITLPPDTAALIAGQSDLVADVFINGTMVNPDYVSVSSTQIVLSGGTQVLNGDEYAVTIQNVVGASLSGVTLTSPDGTRWTVTVSDAGALSTVEIV